MNKKDNLDRIHIVLVEPQDSANIGSVCRAMKTMGINSLDIVGRDTFDIDRLKSLSVHAFDVFEKATLYKDLDQCLSSSSFSVAFTRRKGKFRKITAFTPSELTKFISSYPEGDISLVFGRENNGLNDNEVKCCNAVCTIETSPQFPSLNLSQSVQIASYSLFTGISDYNTTKRAISLNTVDKVVDNAVSSLESIGYFKQGSKEKQDYEIFIKDFVSRGSFSENERKKIDKFFTKLSLIVKYKHLL